MTFEEIKAMDEAFLTQNYGPRLPFAFVRGEGAWLFDGRGRRYLDFLSGIATCTLGHSHPRLVAALCDQVQTVLHTSNFFFIGPQASLAKLLVELSGLDRAFFCNSGAEANEALLKAVRRWSAAQWGEGERPTVLCFENSFHGRTLATLTATGQAKVQAGFAPLMPGFRHVPFGDLAAARDAVDETVCAVLVEPVQGEGGINPATPEFLGGLRELCDERGIKLLLDEVQTGIGRCGTMFAYEAYGLVPDGVSLAKGLGGGVPIGAVVLRDDLAEALAPGSHGTTFGGNFLAARAGLTVLETIRDERLLDNCRNVGGRLRQGLDRLAKSRDDCLAARGRGMLLALQLSEPKAAAVRDQAAERGLIINAVKPDAVRLAPPLILSADEADQGLAILEAALDAA